MRTHTRRNERGVALLVAMFALLLLSAIGMGMMFSANMETSIDANFRDKQIATYAALSGLQEARDRIQPATGDIPSPADLPTSGSPNIVYILNPRGSETITPWNMSSKYPDTELCHESVLGLTGTADTPCTTIASGSGWYSSLDNGSSSYTGAYCASSNSCNCPTGGCKLTQPLLHKWVRIMLKADNMTPFGVNGTGSSGNQVCWNGTNQITRPGGYGPNCAPDGSITIQSFTGGSGYTSAPTVTISAPGAGGIQATATATVTITPTGQLSSISVTSPGNNYSANTGVIITGGGGIGATAVALVGTAGGQVNSLTLNSAGTACYGGPAAPTVTFVPTSGGSGATATSTLTGATCIYSISISGTCAAQANNLNVPFSVAGGGGGGFSGTVGFKNNGSVKNGTTVITNPGASFSSSPTSWSVSGCSGMTITSATLGYKVQSLNLTAGGNGYGAAPTVSIAVPPVGSTPTATATVTSGSGTPGQILSVTLTNPGSGYLTPPLVTFSDPALTGTGATAIASLATTGTVTGVTLTNAGKGYTADPTITLSGGGGSGATAVGTIAHGFTYGQVFELTSYAETPSGTRAMSQMEAVTPVRGFSVTGALTLDGPNPTFSPPNSLNMVVNGNDGNSCGGVAQPPHPSVGVYDDPNNPPSTGSQTAVQYVTTQVDAAKPANYIGAKPSPDIENVFGSLGDTMGTPEGLAAFSTAVYSVAHANGTNYGSNPPGIAMGTASNPVIDFIDGDVTLSGSSTGYGILFVTGNLTFGGNFNWNGPVLVIGKGGFAQFNGGGNGLITGTVFVAKIYDSSGNLLPSLGSPDVTWQGGGGNGIQYDHCWADNMLAKVPFTPPPSTKPLKVLSTRTITY